MSDARHELEIYEQRIMNLDDSDSPDELELDVFLVLSTRDSLERVVFTDGERRMLARLDARLREHADVIAGFLPGPNPPGRDHWWWYLHEKPRVRQKAKQASS